MPAKLRQQILQVERIGKVTLVRFTLGDVLELNTILLIGRQLNSLVESGTRRLVVSFRDVNRLSTPLVGKLIELHHRLKAVRGALALCSIAPDLFEIFEILKLPRLLSIHPTEQEALEGMGAGA